MWTVYSEEAGGKLLVVVLERGPENSTWRLAPLSVRFEFCREDHADLVFAGEDNPLGYDLYLQGWCQVNLPEADLLSCFGSLEETALPAGGPRELETGEERVDEYRRGRKRLLEALAERQQKSTGSERLSPDQLEDVAGGLTGPQEEEDSPPDPEE